MLPMVDWYLSGTAKNCLFGCLNLFRYVYSSILAKEVILMCILFSGTLEIAVLKSNSWQKLSGFVFWPGFHFVVFSCTISLHSAVMQFRKRNKLCLRHESTGGQSPAKACTGRSTITRNRQEMWVDKRNARKRKRKEKCRSNCAVKVGGCAECDDVVSRVRSCFAADSPVSLPLVPPYHLCLSHLKGWLFPLLFSPFVLLTNVAALKGRRRRVRDWA